MFADLLRPFAYLRIKHPGSSFFQVNWLMPGVLTLILVGVTVYWFRSANLFHPGGLFEKLLSFVQSLPGFYLAALAAVATFQQPTLDTEMRGVPPTVEIVYDGQLFRIDLTRRRLLCLMFSYLTAISFLITLALICATTLAQAIGAMNEHLQATLRFASMAVLLGATLQMLCITFWGLYYLGERMHTPDN